MAEEGEESRQAERMVESAASKDDRALPIFWNEREQPDVARVLQKHIKACIQMGKQAKSEEEFYTNRIRQYTCKEVAEAENLLQHLQVISVRMRMFD